MPHYISLLPCFMFRYNYITLSFKMTKRDVSNQFSGYEGRMPTSVRNMKTWQIYLCGATTAWEIQDRVTSQIQSTVKDHVISLSKTCPDLKGKIFIGNFPCFYEGLLIIIRTWLLVYELSLFKWEPRFLSKVQKYIMWSTRKTS